MSRRAHYSASALADAASGRRLPSLALTLAYVRACDGDTATWEERWHALAAELAAPPSGGRDDTRAPYAGLAMFQVEDAERFYGRKRLVAELSKRVTHQRFVVVVGPSGSGKSSLLRAGLVHQARTNGLSGAAGLTMLMTPGPHPLEECAAQLGALTDNTPSALHAELRTDPRCLHLTALRAVVDRPASDDVLVVVDQFEEVFTLCRDDDERAQFLRVLRTAARVPNSRTRIVLGLRADFYAHCAHNPELVEALSDGQVLVGPMSPEELRSAITQPALDAGYRVETALVSQVIAEAIAQPGALPLVSHALLETWRRRRGNTLTLAGYEAAGGITRSIAHTAEAVYRDLTEDQQRWARQLFLRLVALGEGTEDTKRWLDRTELDMDSPDRGEVLDRLARARLVTLDRDTVELTHEALVRSWPRLHGWLTDSRDGLRIHRQLTDAANTWQALRRDPGTLYRGYRLTQAHQWATTHGEGTLSTREREFLSASLSEQARGQAAARRRTRRLRQLFALLTVLVVAASAATVYALRAERVAAEQRNLAIAQKVLSQATASRATNPALSFQLSLAAYRLAQPAEARGVLLNLFTTPYATQLAQHADVVVSVAFSSDGRTLATASGDKTVRLWDIATPHHPRELATLTGQAEMLQAALSPDGHTLATASADKTVRLWDISDRGQPRQLASLASDAAARYLPISVTFSPDGRTLVTAGPTDDHHGIALLWDVANPGEPRRQATLTGQFGATYAAVFMPGGRTLATVSSATTALPVSRSEVRLWDVTDRTQPRDQAALTEFTGRTVVAFHPDGRTLATGQEDATMTLWDITEVHHPRSRFVLNGFAGATALAFSPDGHTLATASADRTVRLWDMPDTAQPRVLTTLTGAKAGVHLLAFSPDGRTLATATSERTVRLDDVADYAYPTRAHGAVHSVAFSPDGRTLATGNADGTTELWDTTDPYRTRQRAILATDIRKGPVSVVAFSPNGQALATDDQDSTMELWDVNRPSTPASTIVNAAAPVAGFSGLSFSPDGRILATGSADRTAILWDVTDVYRPRRLTILTGFNGSINSIAFGPTGRVLAVGGGESSTRLWDVSDPHTPRELSTVDFPGTGTINAVAFSPDARTLAIGTSDHTVRLWDISDPRAPRTLTTITSPSAMGDVAFSPDGHTMASGLVDGSAELWVITDRHHPQGPITLTGPASGGHGIFSIAFSPTNRLLATSGASPVTVNRNARLWDTDIERVAARICELAWPRITATDWNQYFPGIAYQPPCP